MDSLVTTDWLADNLGAHDLAVLDASRHLPAAKRDPRAEFESAHIPGALFSVNQQTVAGLPNLFCFFLAHKLSIGCSQKMRSNCPKVALEIPTNYAKIGCLRFCRPERHFVNTYYFKLEKNCGRYFNHYQTRSYRNEIDAQVA